MESLFLLVLGNTEISTVPGISVAGGATPELTKLTPIADAEYLFHEKPPLTVDVIPVTPEGIQRRR